MADLEVACGVVVVVVVVVVASEEEASLDDVVVAVEGVVSVREAWVVVVVVLAPELLAPGCSFATTTPTSAVDAVAAMTADCVRRRRRTLARVRVSEAVCSLGWFTMASLRGVSPWNHPGLSPHRELPVSPV